MDDIVKQAMAKWPNVPHCYGWLALDARGNWRMRDERAQALSLPGDKIRNPALLSFIHRNYLRDERGRWYFQNGPQRVYVNLEATPYIARTDPEYGFVLQTDEPLEQVDKAWMTETGQLLLQHNDKVALVDDRDMSQCLPFLRSEDHAASDEELLDWLASAGAAGQLHLHHAGRDLPVHYITMSSIPGQFGFVPSPQSD